LDTEPLYLHKQAAHCESGVVSSLLRHHGLDLSEAMVFGLSSALMFSYIPIIKINGMPLISYRNIPRGIIKGIQSRLGIKFKTITYNNQLLAHNELLSFMDRCCIVGLQTSVYWLPYFPPEMRFQFNAHNLIVYGRNNGELLISDPVFDHVVRIKPEDLQNARFAKGILAPKGYLYYPLEIPAALDLDKAIRRAIKKTVFMMLPSPPPFGIRGIHYLANSIGKLGQNADKRYIKLLLGHIVRMQEEIGTGGGGFRYLYAAFLQEASQILSLSELEEASLKMTEAGDLWRAFALSAVGYIKDKGTTLPEIANRIRQCAHAEKDVFSFLKSIV
jgi:Domain of unknown function (DUF4872)/Butirosin biosynthesis protein H, N-terminal